ncbi:MAG: transposase [Planctomycetota bacterium]
MVFADESGFMLQPTVRRTWAPKGQTPIHYSWDRRDRLSVISAITLSPQRRHMGLYFTVFDQNITADEAEPFVADLLDHFPNGIILVWDRWMVHRSAARRLAGRFERRVVIEWLPAYAPELNPTEQVWNRAKYIDLANFIPDNIQHLARSVRKSLRKSRSQQPLLRSFFKHAELAL